MLDFQKASLLKRMMAAIFDFILLIIAIVGFALIFNSVFAYDAKLNDLQGYYEKYEQEYNVKLNISAEEYQKLTDTEKTHYEDVIKKMNDDKDFTNVYVTIISQTFLIITFSVLLSFLFLEFLVPLLFKNGQTMGKKIFSIGLMREDGVKMTHVMLFIRAILGKYTLLTMIPIYIVLLIFFGFIGIDGSIIIMALFFGNLILLFASKKHTAIHDKMSGTVMVDMQSQLIFDTPEALLEYKQKLHKEKVEQTES